MRNGDGSEPSLPAAAFLEKGGPERAAWLAPSSPGFFVMKSGHQPHRHLTKLVIRAPGLRGKAQPFSLPNEIEINGPSLQITLVCACSRSREAGVAWRTSNVRQDICASLPRSIAVSLLISPGFSHVPINLGRAGRRGVPKWVLVGCEVNRVKGGGHLCLTGGVGAQLSSMTLMFKWCRKVNFLAAPSIIWNTGLLDISRVQVHVRPCEADSSPFTYGCATILPAFSNQLCAPKFENAKLGK